MFDNYIHRVEKARERTSELFDEFKQMNDTLADHKKTVSELADRYEELSKGVNLSTNDNVFLSTEEYEEFLDINEQLASSFPELEKGIDENGNSILTLGTKGITAKEQLEELLQTEEDLNNFRIAQGLEDAFKGVYTYVEDANEATEKLNSTISDSSEAMSKLQDIAENGIRLTGEDGQLIFVGNTNNQAELDYMNSLTASVNEFWKSLDGSRRMELGIDPSYLLTQNFDEYTGAFEVYANLYNLTPEELTTLENIIQDNVGDASGALLDSISDQSQELQEQIQQGENAWRDFIPNLVSGMKSKQTFKDLDSDLQDIAIQIVEGLDYSYATAMKEWNPNDPYAYIRDKLIVPMGDLSDTDKQIIKDSFTKLMTLNPEDISDSNREAISELITKIADILEKDEIEIKVALGFNVGDDAKKRLQNSIRLIADDHGIEDREQVAELNEVTKDFTLSEIELWLEATQGAKNATQAIEMYKDALKKAKGEASDDLVIPTISSSVQQLATQLEPQFAKLGEAYQAIFTDNGFTLDNVDNSMLEDLRQSFAEIEEEIGVAFDATKLDPFFNAITNENSTMEQVQQAFNELATAYFYSTDTLEQLNSETADAIEKQLEEMGVQNATEVVADALTAKTEELIVAKEYLAQTGEELASATEEEQTAFILEQIEAGNCGEALALLQLKKVLVNSTQINTAADIQQIMNLASTAGMGTEVLTQLANAKSIFETVEAGGTVSLSSYEKALSDVESAKQTMLNWKPIEIDFGNTGGGSSKAGKEAGDAYVDAFEEELKELQRLRDDGVITEKEYLDRLRALYEKYFKDKLGYEKEFSKYQRQYLEGYKSLYESVLSSISKLMNHQIDGYNDAKEAAVSSLTEEKEARLEVINAQKEQLEAEQDLIDEQIEQKQKIIDGIQDEIDAMKEANIERQRQLDLQKAQYELERMQNQRTKLVNYMPDTIVI